MTLAQATCARCELLCILAGDTFDTPPFNGSTGATRRGHPGLTRRSDTLQSLRAELKATCHHLGVTAKGYQDRRKYENPPKLQQSRNRRQVEGVCGTSANQPNQPGQLEEKSDYRTSHL